MLSAVMFRDFLKTDIPIEPTRAVDENEISVTAYYRTLPILAVLVMSPFFFTLFDL